MSPRIASEIPARIEAFDLQPGRVIARKYVLESKLGAGWEGEVYRVRETQTGIERAAKLFFPHRNPSERTSRLYAKKLHQLRHCALLIQYHTEERIVFRRQPVTVLISEYVEGVPLPEFLRGLPPRRLGPFEALHLLHNLAKGLEQIHLAGGYHGDLHADNVIVKRYGLHFHLKLLDLLEVKSSKTESRREDICDLVRIFYDCLGGARHYSRQPKPVKAICCGLKRGLILDRFPTMSRLCEHLETMSW